MTTVDLTTGTVVTLYLFFNHIAWSPKARLKAAPIGNNIIRVNLLCLLLVFVSCMFVGCLMDTVGYLSLRLPSSIIMSAGQYFWLGGLLYVCVWGAHMTIHHPNYLKVFRFSSLSANKLDFNVY